MSRSVYFTKCHNGDGARARSKRDGIAQPMGKARLPVNENILYI